MPAMLIPLTAIIRSPTFNSSQRSAGLPGMSFPLNENSKIEHFKTIARASCVLTIEVVLSFYSPYLSLSRSIGSMQK